VINLIPGECLYGRGELLWEKHGGMVGADFKRKRIPEVFTYKRGSSNRSGAKH